MKSFIKLALVIVLCIGVTVPAFAAGRFAYLDLSRIFNDYTKTVDNDAAIEAVYEQYAKERDAKVEKIKEEQGKLALLKEDEKIKVQQNIEKMTAALNQFDQSEQTELTKLRDERVREILLEIENVVSDYAKKEKIDVVLNDRVLIFGADSLNITEPVLKTLNDNYNKKEK